MYHKELLQFYFGYTLMLFGKGHAEICPLPPKDGMCANSTTTFDDKGELKHSMENGTCTVWKTLCSYHQGCADLPVMKWTTKVDFVEVKGQNGCQEIYSVLQSPSLKLPETFCLRIKIVQALPSLLAVFLVKTEGVMTLFNRIWNLQYPTDFSFTLPANQAKIMFRARSGGSDTGYVQLHSVKLDLGTCIPLACFHGSSKTPFCGWSMQNWSVMSISRELEAFVRIANTTGTLKSLLTSATMADSNCLSFQYQLSGENSTLSVFLEPFTSEHTQLLWSLTSSETTSEIWEQASLNLVSNVAFKIVFKGVRCGSHNSSISIRDVQYRTRTKCTLTPMEANRTTEQIRQCIYESTVETTTSAAEVTTSHGHHDITCTESRMEFSIPLSSPHTSETATLSDPNCQINVTRTHVRGGVDLNSCGTTVQFQNDSVIFRNAIIFSAPESSSLGSSGSNSSVSQYQDIIPIQCVYNRLATVHLSYMPVVRRVLFTESGVGQFSFNIQQFWDASFTNMVSDGAYPLRMELDADVFIQLSVGSEGQPVAGHKEIGMEVQQCLVSPSSSVIEAQLHYYPLIQDGCPASSDVHIIPNTNASDSTVMRFRFRAVNFFDPSSSSSSSLVFVHCRMGLCLTGSCKPSAWSCLTPPARRVRRDVDQSKRAAHQLSTGPFLIMADEASTSSSSTTATVMAVVSTSVATVAIVIAAIALIALRRRRTTERN